VTSFNWDLCFCKLTDMVRINITKVQTRNIQSIDEIYIERGEGHFIEYLKVIYKSALSINI